MRRLFSQTLGIGRNAVRSVLPDSHLAPRLLQHNIPVQQGFKKIHCLRFPAQSASAPVVTHHGNFRISHWLSQPALREYNTYRQSYRQWGVQRSCEISLRLLVATNALVFLGWRVDPAFMQRNFLTSLEHIRSGRIHTILTSCFSQRDFFHLAANMFTLYFFWDRRFSGRLVLFLYVAGGVAGNVAFLLHEYSKIMRLYDTKWGREMAIRHSPRALGASGSVNASVIFNILHNPYSTVLIYGVIPAPAFVIGLVWIYFDVVGALGGQQSGARQIGYTAHLGGASVGALTYWAYARGLLRL